MIGSWKLRFLLVLLLTDKKQSKEEALTRFEFLNHGRGWEKIIIIKALHYFKERKGDRKKTLSYILKRGLLWKEWLAHMAS